MACCSLTFPATANAKSPSSSTSAGFAAAAVAVSPSPYYSGSRSVSHSQFLKSSRGIYYNPCLSFHYHETLARCRLSRRPPHFLVVSSGNKPEPLKVMISGAPASGKGTQCQLIAKKFVENANATLLLGTFVDEKSKAQEACCRYHDDCKSDFKDGPQIAETKGQILFNPAVG
ncbi:adenylate kinase [Sarracenia purpurea var. burkii]